MPKWKWNCQTCILGHFGSAFGETGETQIGNKSFFSWQIPPCICLDVPQLNERGLTCGHEPDSLEFRWVVVWINGKMNNSIPLHFFLNNKFFFQHFGRLDFGTFTVRQWIRCFPFHSFIHSSCIQTRASGMKKNKYGNIEVSVMATTKWKLWNKFTAKISLNNVFFNFCIFCPSISGFASLRSSLYAAWDFATTTAGPSFANSIIILIRWSLQIVSLCAMPMFSFHSH